MASFDINRTYSATFTVSKAQSGWRANGKIWDRRTERATEISFIAVGRTRQAAYNRATEEAERVCPPEEKEGE
jgi:hypothetical protein